MFSSRWATDDVPGIGSIAGERWRSHDPSGRGKEGRLTPRRPLPDPACLPSPAR
jgi:hypothetical protein